MAPSIPPPPPPPPPNSTSSTHTHTLARPISGRRAPATCTRPALPLTAHLIPHAVADQEQGAPHRLGSQAHPPSFPRAYLSFGAILPLRWWLYLVLARPCFRGGRSDGGSRTG